MLTARRKPPGRDRPEADKVFNQSISKLRAAVERAIAHPKDGTTSPPATAAPSPAVPASSEVLTMRGQRVEGAAVAGGEDLPVLRVGDRSLDCGTELADALVEHLVGLGPVPAGWRGSGR